jgi:hypothetical protein
MHDEIDSKDRTPSRETKYDVRAFYIVSFIAIIDAKFISWSDMYPSSQPQLQIYPYPYHFDEFLLVCIIIVNREAAVSSSKAMETKAARAPKGARKS